jgi:Zn-dependent peptidase ImmA (M78 family)/transcriptional regulator with XRE-family HTH domain
MISGTPGFVGERLRESREAMGLTMTSLADLLGVSKQAISQYEKGQDTPRAEVLDRICKLFRHEPHFFLTGPASWMEPMVVFYRSMASSTKSARQKAEARQQWMREIINYISHYIELPKPNLLNGSHFPSNPNLLAIETVEDAASRLRDHWGLGQGPITNLTRSLEHNGVIVLRHPLEADTMDALSGWCHPEGRPFVLLNSEKNCAVRSRLDLAHELGHLALHQQVAQSTLQKSEQFSLIETQAFRFGAALLLPEKPFLSDLYSISLDAMRVLKRKWKVSIAMMIERLKDLEVIDSEQHRKMRINYIARKWSKKEPFDDELTVELPSLIPTALKILLEGKVQSVEQIAAGSGFSPHWLSELLNMPAEYFNPPQLGLKVLPFKRFG